jgi:hypothetical protein
MPMSMLHVQDTCPCCMSMLRAQAACLYNRNLHVHAAAPYCMSKVACPFFMSILHVHVSCLCLKVHLHEIFDLWFFSSKEPTWSPDSYPKFVSNIMSNSPRYSKYSTLRVDSVHGEYHSAPAQYALSLTRRRLSISAV